VIADSVVALLMHAQSSASSVRLTSKPCRHPREESTSDSKGQKKPKAEELDAISSRLRFIYSLLKEQFQNVEAVYEGVMGTYEIVTDAGLETGVLDDEGKLTCTVKVEYDCHSGTNAKVSVESRDHRLAENVKHSIRNSITAMGPVKAVID
jgi:hypothetical protein